MRVKVCTQTHRHYLHIPTSVGTQGHPCQVTQTLAHPGTLSCPFLQQHPAFARVPEVQQSPRGAHKEVHTHRTDTTFTHIAETQGTRVGHANVRYGIIYLTRAPRGHIHTHTSTHTDCDISPTHINTGSLGQCPPGATVHGPTISSCS